MEKIVAALWAVETMTRADFNASLISDLVPALKRAGAMRVRVNIQDASVDAGAGLRQVNTHPQMDAIVQFWMLSSYAPCLAPVDQALAGHCERFGMWLVTESTIIENTTHPAQPSERAEGFSQLALLGQPPRLAHEEWRAIWQGSHTKVAIETQSNFEYIQNLVVRPLTDGGPEIVALVEECFPIEALTDPFVFFDAVGDQAKFDANLATMMDSCGRFIDFDRIDVLITSQFNFA